MTDSAPPTGVPFIDAARLVYRAWNVISPSVPTKITAADRAALDRAGWSVIPGKVQVWVRPDGTRTSINEANRAAAILRTPGIAAPTVSPVPQLPTGGEILDDLLRRPRARAPAPPTELERLLRRGPQTDFERLMDRTYNPGGRTGTVADATRATRPGVALGAILARSAGLLLSGLLWPSPIGYEAPLRTGRRPRARRPTQPPRPTGRPVAVPLPQSPTTLPRMPQAAPNREPSPTRRPPVAYIPAPYLPAPVAVPVPSMPRPLPAPLSGPSPLLALPLLAPFLLSGSSSSSAPRVTTPNFTAPSPRPIVAPLTAPLTAPLGSVPPGDPCQCTRTSKPKKKRCANPIISKRTRTENSRKFLTITRELKCP